MIETLKSLFAAKVKFNEAVSL